MNNNTAKRAKWEDKEKIVAFMNQNWGSAHPLINNEELFNFYYSDKENLNFYYIEENGEIAALCGYIKCSKQENSDIWISIWCAKKGKNGLGLALMGQMKELTGARVMACNNIRANTMPFYIFLGYHPDKLEHYYRLKDIEKYKIAVVDKKEIPVSTKTDGVCLKPLNNIAAVKAAFTIPKDILPRKDYWYINKRYFEYPHYKYNVFAVCNGDDCSALVVFRVNKSEQGKVLRIVDYIGKPKDFYLLNGQIDILLENFDCEYCDMYSFGIEGKSAGFVQRTPEDSNIIPNYLNPLLLENTDYYFFTTETNNFMMFKADGDQDRKNLG